MPRPVKGMQVSADREKVLLWLERTWEGPAIVLGEGILNLVVIDRPGDVVVPLGENHGALSRQRIVEEFHQVAPFNADVYVVEVSSPAGERRYGMFAAPTWIEPSVRTDTV